MKPFVVLAKNPETVFIKRLIEEVGNSFVLLWNPWQVTAPPAHLVPCLVRSTGVYGDDRDLEALEIYRGEILNSLSALRRFRRKSTQYEFCGTRGISVLPWLSLQSVSDSGLERWLAEHPSPHYLCKPDRGQGGWGITVHSTSELRAWVKAQRCLGDVEFVVQPLVTGATEYRTFFIDDERWTLERTPDAASVTANFQQAGSARTAEAPASATAVERLITQSDARYGAVDYLMKGDECFILELNIAPGIEQLEAVSGLNVMATLVRKLLSSH